MTSGPPWSVKGIDPRARAAAKSAARKHGLTLGEWLNRVILDDGAPSPGRDWDDRLSDYPGFDAGRDDADDGASGLHGVVRRLTDRLESAEQRSTLALTGVDQSVLALSRRLDQLEDSLGEDEDGTLEAIARTRAQQEELLERIRRLEKAGPGTGGDPAALKALEDAVGKLAGRLFETERDVRTELDNLAHRDERRRDAGERSAKALAARLDETEKRLKDESLSLRELVETRTKASHDRLNSMDEAARRLQSRIAAAENATHQAAEALTRSQEKLDERLRGLEASQGANFGADEMNRRFEALGRELGAIIRETREDCARQIAALPRGGGDAAGFERALEAAEMRLGKAETRQADALARIGQDVSRLARAVDRRIEEAERRLEQRFGETERARREREDRAGMEARLDRLRADNSAAVRRIGEEVARLGETLADRVHQAEQRSAQAVETAGERMAQIVEKIETARPRSGEADLETRIRASEERTAKRIDQAMEGVHARLDQARSETADALSPVQRAMSALADRLEAIEGRGAGNSRKETPRETAPESSAPLPQPPGLDDEWSRQDAGGDPGMAEDAFVVDAEAPLQRAQAAAAGKSAQTRVRPQAETAKPEPAPPPRPARPGATADAGFLAAARKTVRTNAGSGAQWDQDGESSGRRRGLLIGSAGVLGFVAVAAAAGMLAMEAISGPGEPARQAADSTEALSALFAGPGAASRSAEREEPSGPAPEIAVEAAPAEAAPQTDSETVTAEPEEPAAAAPEPREAPARQPDPEPEPMTLESAAAAGDPVARYQLALRRLEAGGTRDAEALMRRAAEQGVPDAQRRYALMVQSGTSSAPANEAEAREWMVRAAENGNVQAMYDAGSMFINADDGDVSQGEAARWFEQAALHGYRDSQFNIALLFQEGFGVPQSPADAYAWFLIAASGGDSEAASRAAALRRDLSPEQRAEAEAAARNFTPRTPDPEAQGDYPPQAWQTGGSVSASEEVRHIQALLADLGYDPGPADGVMGARTRQAVNTFLRDQGEAPGAPLDARLISRLQRASG